MIFKMWVIFSDDLLQLKEATMAWVELMCPRLTLESEGAGLWLGPLASMSKLFHDWQVPGKNPVSVQRTDPRDSGKYFQRAYMTVFPEIGKATTK